MPDLTSSQYKTAQVQASDKSSSADLKAKLVAGRVEVEAPPKPPLADDYLYDFQYNHPLPTLDSLGVQVSDDLDPVKEAQLLSDRLAEVLGGGDAEGFSDLFVDFGVWRDKLAFTWDYRTFNDRKNILKAAKDLLLTTHSKNFKFLTPTPSIRRPYPDLAYLQFVLSFDTKLVKAHAVANAVLTSDGWRLWTFHTVAESLHDFPGIQSQDGHMTGDISWEKQRAKDVDEVKPDVVIVGGGQNGLALAAHLNALGVPNLIIEKDEPGKIWTKRYEALTLHMPHWADHLPFFPYPAQWPTYTPAQKQGLFMEWYASALELAVWNHSTVAKAEVDASGVWTVQINKGGKELRTLHPKHVVMATSLCGVPVTPVIPGMDQFTAGIIRHSTAHDNSRDFVGKKVLIVGTSSSGFDTAYECARRGIDVTLLQRSPTYIMSLTHSVPRMIGSYKPDANGVRPDIEEQDRLAFSMPLGPGEELARRNTEVLQELDRELLDGLNSKGLRTWQGQRGTGVITLGQTRNGGFYFDGKPPSFSASLPQFRLTIAGAAGACEQILNGNIKVEPGFVERFTKDKVILSGGREKEYDLVVFATGFSNTIDSVRNTLGSEIADKCGPIWGIDEEGEFRTAYRETGVLGLWIMVGFLPYTRFHSKRVALRLKALIEGISPPPYKT